MSGFTEILASSLTPNTMSLVYSAEYDNRYFDARVELSGTRPLIDVGVVFLLGTPTVWKWNFLALRCPQCGLLASPSCGAEPQLCCSCDDQLDVTTYVALYDAQRRHVEPEAMARRMLESALDLQGRDALGAMIEAAELWDCLQSVVAGAVTQWESGASSIR